MDADEDRPTLRLNRDKLLAFQAFVSDAAHIVEEAKDVVAAKMEFEEGCASTMRTTPTSNRTSRTTPTRTTPPAPRYSRPAEQQAWLRSSVQGLGMQRVDGPDQVQPSAFAVQHSQHSRTASMSYHSSLMAQRKTSVSGAAGAGPGESTAQPIANTLDPAIRVSTQPLLSPGDAAQYCSPSKTSRENGVPQCSGTSHSPPARKRTSSFTGTSSSSQPASPLRASLALGTVGLSNSLRQASETGSTLPIPPLIPRAPAGPMAGAQGEAKAALKSSIIVTEDQPSIMARWAVHGTTGAAGAFGPTASTVYYPPTQPAQATVPEGITHHREEAERPSQAKDFTFSDLIYQASGLDKKGMGFTRRGSTTPGIVGPSITDTFANRTASSTSGAHAVAPDLLMPAATSMQTQLPPVRQSQSISAGTDYSTPQPAATAAADNSLSGSPILPAGMIMSIAQYKQMEAAEQAGNLPERDSAVRSSLTGLAAAAVLLRQQGNGSRVGQLDAQDSSLLASAAAGSSTPRAMGTGKKGPILSSTVSPNKGGTGLTSLSKQMLLHTPALAGRTLVVASRHADPAESLRISTEQLKRDMRFRHPRM